MADSNPFQMPPDEELFEFRKKEKERKKKARETKDKPPRRTFQRRKIKDGPNPLLGGKNY